MSAQEDPDAEFQFIDINFQNDIEAYNFLKNKNLMQINMILLEDLMLLNF